MFGTVSGAPEGPCGATGGGVAIATSGIGVGPAGAAWPKTSTDKASSTAARQGSLNTGLFTYSPYHGQSASPRIGFTGFQKSKPPLKKTAAASSTVKPRCIKKISMLRKIS